MSFDLDRYKRVVGALELEGIDFGDFRRRPLAPEHLRCIRYMHDVELHTSCYLRNLLNTPAHADPEISEFLTLWAYEELWHGDALGAVLRAHDEPSGADRVAPLRRGLGWQLKASPLGWMAMSAATPHFLAVHMTFGVINEWTTQGGYARLATLAEHPVLADLLHRIMKQEGRHIDFYLTQARARLAPRGAQRAVRVALRTLWSPVGSKVMPKPETAHLGSTLFGDSEGRDVLSRIDRRIDRLPGLADLHLVSQSVDRRAAIAA